MQVYFKQNLAFLSVPKTGTTAFELALRPFADIIFTKRLKHMTAARFHNRLAPFLDATYDTRPERMAVMRDPIEQIRSWYRYRARAAAGAEFRTGGISFDEFVLQVISDDPPPHAGIGSQLTFLSLGDGTVPVHHLFAYERQPLLRGFLEERFGEELTIKRKNVSPDVEAPLSADVEAKLRAARAAEFGLYQRILDADGVLRGWTG